MKKKLINKILIAQFISISLFLFSFTLVGAQPSAGAVGGGARVVVSEAPIVTAPLKKLPNPIEANNIQTLLLTVVDIAIAIGSMIATVMFLWIGFKFVMARGNQSELKEAKEWFMYAVIGTAILISSKIIVEVIQTTLVNTGVVKESVFNLPKKI